MRKKNEFEKCCDELEIGQVNKVDYVRKYLWKKYNGDLDKLLMIKAEAQEDEVMQYLSNKISIIAMFFSGISVFLMALSYFGMNKILMQIASLIFIILMIIVLIKIGLQNAYKSVIRWRKYILIVIDDLIEKNKQ